MKSLTIRFNDVAVQPHKELGSNSIKRAVGYLPENQLFGLFAVSALAPNPRRATRNSIVNGILASLTDDTPELFKFKSKGILLCSHSVSELERKRFRVNLGRDFVDGVLDGGHNLFAIGLHFLEPVMPEKEHRKIKRWPDLEKAWEMYSEEVEMLLDDFDIEIPVELLYPTSSKDTDLIEFDQAVFDISQARNANAQVKEEAFQNKLGYYDELRDLLDPELAARVEWKSGEIEDPDAGPVISVRDIVALTWIPLNFASQNKLLPIEISVSPQNIYRNKGECSDKFGQLMSRDDVTEAVGGKAGQVRQLKHEAIASCLKVATDIPDIMDIIYEEFPTCYNSNGKNNFGRRKQVQMFDPEKIKLLKAQGKDISGYTATRPVTPFYRRHSAKMVHRYPEAFIIPFVTGLHSLMKVENGKVVWAVDDIRATVCEKLKKAAPLFDSMLDAYNWDPQSLAKSSAVHDFAAQLYGL